MPPKVMDEVVTGRPIGDLAGEPVAPFARTAVHFEDMCLDVMREIIAAVGFERRVHGAFGRRVVAGFLMGKGPDALEAVIARKVGGPAGRETVRLFEDLVRLVVAE